MSFKALAWAWEQTTGSAGKKAVLMALAQFAREDGRCYVSQASIAQHTEQGERTVRTHLHALETDGYIMRSARKLADGTVTSDLISLNLLWPFSPPANFADGEKLQIQRPKTAKPAAKMAAKNLNNKKQQNPCAHARLQNAGVSDNVARDFLAQRSAKGVSDTMLQRLQREAEAAGLSLDQALGECVLRGWRSFKAEWVKPAASQDASREQGEANRYAELFRCAVDAMICRRQRQPADWPTPGLFWAAMEMGPDLLTLGYGELAGRWRVAVDAYAHRGDPIPDVVPERALPAPDSRDLFTQRLNALRGRLSSPAV